MHDSLQRLDKLGDLAFAGEEQGSVMRTCVQRSITSCGTGCHKQANPARSVAAPLDASSSFAEAKSIDSLCSSRRQRLTLRAATTVLRCEIPTKPILVPNIIISTTAREPLSLIRAVCHQVHMVSAWPVWSIPGRM